MTMRKHDKIASFDAHRRATTAAPGPRLRGREDAREIMLQLKAQILGRPEAALRAHGGR